MRAVIVVSKGFTSADLFQFDPLFNRDGCISVILWGLAYASMSTAFHSAPYICLVFALEKVFYYQHWHISIVSHGTSRAGSAQFFYKVYGIGDQIFAGFFFFVFGQSLTLVHTANATLAVQIGAGCAAAGLVLPVVAVCIYARKATATASSVQMP